MREEMTMSDDEMMMSDGIMMIMRWYDDDYRSGSTM